MVDGSSLVSRGSSIVGLSRVLQTPKKVKSKSRVKGTSLITKKKSMQLVKKEKRTKVQLIVKFLMLFASFQRKNSCLDTLELCFLSLITSSHTRWSFKFNKLL